MTARKTKETTARARAKADHAPPVVHIVDTDDRETAERKYACSVEGWADLPKLQRDAILTLGEQYRKMPQPLQVALDHNDTGGYVMRPADGDSAIFHALKTAETFASASPAFSTDKLNDLINHFGSSNNRGARALELNAALAFIQGAKPQNEVEATLAVQMVATNDAAMRALAMIGKADWVPQIQLFGNLAVKLLRTFAMQAEALGKLQRGGEQVVKHVHVDNRGGQAVIAETVHNGGTGNGKYDEQSRTAGTAGRIAALPGPDPFGNGMPIPSREREKAMQDARGHESGGT